MTQLTRMPRHSNKDLPDTMRKILRMLALVIALPIASLAQASIITTSFAGIGPRQLDGVSVGDWTFRGDWEAFGYDSKKLPAMNTGSRTHSISYNKGLFDFQSMSLVGSHGTALPSAATVSPATSCSTSASSTNGAISSSPMA